MGLLKKIFSREKDFYGMLLRQADISLQGMHMFCLFMHGEMPADAVAQISRVEHEGDQARRALIDALNHTFVTPMEREDIFGLSRLIDDVLDLAKSAVEEFCIYGLTPNPDAEKMAVKVREGARALREAVARLKTSPAQAVQHCTAAKDAVDEFEIICYQALATLVEGTDFKYIFKMREVYKSIFQLSDRVDDAANVILDIIVKTT